MSFCSKVIRLIPGPKLVAKDPRGVGGLAGGGNRTETWNSELDGQNNVRRGINNLNKGNYTCRPNVTCKGCVHKMQGTEG